MYCMSYKYIKPKAELCLIYFSSGICLCYLVTGCHPYHMSFKDNYATLYFKILQGSTLPSFLSEGKSK